MILIEIVAKARRLFLLFALLILVGCTTTSAKSISERNSELSRGLVYFQDERTEICYVYRSGDRHHTLTNVPCTELVLKAIEQDAWRR